MLCGKQQVMHSRENLINAFKRGTEGSSTALFFALPQALPTLTQPMETPHRSFRPLTTHRADAVKQMSGTRAIRGHADDPGRRTTVPGSLPPTITSGLQGVPTTLGGINLLPRSLARLDPCR